MITKKEAVIRRITHESPDTRSFYLELNDELPFVPGQAITIFIKEKKAAFSIASMPGLGKTIMITVKCHNDGWFTPLLFRKKVGDKLPFIGPYGAFTINYTESEDYYFIAGGIGITPFRSMILSAPLKGTQRPSMHLLYSARDCTSFIFYREFQALESQNLLTSYYTVTSQDPKWNGPRGRIDERVLRRLVTNKRGVFYVCASTGFVDMIQQTLRGMGIKEKNIRIDSWHSSQQ